jgi:hypothetical protein
MSALRVACRTPWGDSHDLLVLQDHVIVPQLLGHVPSLWWLADEHHPRVAVTLVGALEEETGASLGLSPYCVPRERWNEGARAERWLPNVPMQDGLASLDQSRESTDSHGFLQLDGLPLPRCAEPRDADLDGGDRLRAGREGVAELFGWLRRPFAVVLLATASLALAYYLIADGLWLWSLRQGLTGRKVQDGIVILVAGLAVSRIVGAFRTRAARGRGSRDLDRFDGRDRQRILLTIRDGFGLGLSLQLLAFAGFVVF